MAEPDDLSRRLESLEADLGSSTLPGPAEARRRARQRVRRRNAAVAGIVIAVAAGGVGLPVQELLQTGHDLPPATPATTTPSPAPTPATVDPLTEEVLLTPEDLEPAGADEPIGWEVVWDVDSPADPPFEPFACAPQPATGAGAALQRSLAVLEDSEPWEGRTDQIVERFDEPSAAQARFDALREEVLACARDLGAGPAPPEAWAWAGIGEQAWLARYWTAADAPDGLGELVEVSVVQTGTAVTGVTKGFHAMDANLPMEPDLAVAATERLCGAAGGSCVTDPRLDDQAGDTPGDPGNERP